VIQTPKKDYMNLVKPIHGLKNVKNHPKTLNQLETKKLFELRYVFIGVFKVKNT
jgi:hypothetical protein